MKATDESGWLMINDDTVIGSNESGWTMTNDNTVIGSDDFVCHLKQQSTNKEGKREGRW